MEPSIPAASHGAADVYRESLTMLARAVGEVASRHRLRLHKRRDRQGSVTLAPEARSRPASLDLVVSLMVMAVIGDLAARAGLMVRFEVSRAYHVTVAVAATTSA